MKLSLLYLCIVFMTALKSSSEAGILSAEQSGPFETLKVGVEYLSNTNRNLFHEFWDPVRGIDLSIATPFYAGTMRTGISLFPVTAKDVATPDYYHIFVHAGWGKHLRLPADLNLFGGFSIGYNTFILGIEAIEGIRYESELGLMFSLRMSVPVYGNWRAVLGGSHLTVLTHERIELVFLTFGLNYSFDSPLWFRNFMQ
ncbi:MAG: hypothetical protein JSV33_08055 [bacterium]|nr:MAG: hypothetical protein JSV33_08055 [bacterium]